MAKWHVQGVGDVESYVKAVYSAVALVCAGLGTYSALHAKPAGLRTDPGGVSVRSETLIPKKGNDLAAFSGGCFWGEENTFRHVPGVEATAVGYMGGTTKHPTYQQAHATGHAETVLVEFNPKRVSYSKLLDVFWTGHHPTAGKGEKVNVPTSYRSTIWTFNDGQAQEARASFDAQQSKEKRHLLTRIEKVRPFYLAEEEHQQYDEKSGKVSCPAHP